MDSTSIKNKSLQTDFLCKISGMLKTTACMDDAGTERISHIIRQLDSLIDALEENVCAAEPQPPHKATPILTIV